MKNKNPINIIFWDVKILLYSIVINFMDMTLWPVQETCMADRTKTTKSDKYRRHSTETITVQEVQAEIKKK